MLLTPHKEQTELDETIEYYVTHFAHVRKVYCGSDLGEGCGELLALEVSGGPGHAVDERGVTRITIGPALLSTRVRLDEHDSGRMVGYQCGNLIPNPEYAVQQKAIDEAWAQSKHEEDKEKPVPTASPVMRCGNDTRLSEAERHHPPRHGWHVDMLPHEAAQIHSAIKLCGKHKAKFKDEGQVKHYESFRHEVVK